MMKRFTKKAVMSAVVAAVCATTAPGPANAQETHADAVARNNANVVTVMGGSVTGTYIQIVANLAGVVDDGDKMRVLPVVGKGSLKNLEDLIYLKGVDAALMQSDVLDFVKNLEIYPDIDRIVSYITKLYEEEVHLVARNDIQSIEDLRGKKVGFGPETSGTFMTAANIFDAFDIEVEAIPGSYDVALQDLRDGKLDAIVRVAGKPVSYLEEVPFDDNLKLLEIPPVEGSYVQAELSHDDYPGLIPEGSTRQTVAVGAVLAAYNWAPDHPRRPKVEKLVTLLGEKIDELRQDPYHPKWQLVDLEADLPGWKRFNVYGDWSTPVN